MVTDEEKTKEEIRSKSWNKGWEDFYRNFKDIKTKKDLFAFWKRAVDRILDPNWSKNFYTPEVGQEVAYSEGWNDARESILKSFERAKKDRKLSLLFLTLLPLVSIVIEVLIYLPESYGRPVLSPYIGYVNGAVFTAFGFLGIFLYTSREESYIPKVFLVYFIFAHLAYFLMFHFYPYKVGYSNWTEDIQKRSEILDIPKNQDIADSVLVSKTGHSGLYGYIIYHDAYGKQSISPEDIPDDFDPVWIATKLILPISQWLAKEIFQNVNLTWLILTFLWYLLSWIIVAVFTLSLGFAWVSIKGS